MPPNRRSSKRATKLPARFDDSVVNLAGKKVGSDSEKGVLDSDSITGDQLVKESSIEGNLGEKITGEESGIKGGNYSNNDLHDKLHLNTLTVIGFFVGFKMSAPELRYHLRRMWGRFGLKDVIVNSKGQCFFKFNNEEGMNRVVEQGPCKVPVWVKLYNVPLEAWCVEGLSAIASSIGKPVVMDSMTTIMCSNGMGRFEYARVLVEIDDKKEFKEEIELQYRGKDGSIRGYKKKRERTEEELVEIEQKKNSVTSNGDMSKGMEGSKSNGNHMEKKVPPARTSKNDKGKANTNQFSVLEEEENDEVQELNMLMDKMLVDKYLNKKVYPSKEEMSLWIADMRMYFKKQWEIDRQKEIEDAKIGMEEIEEDVIDNTPLVDKILTANKVVETHIKSINLKGICDKVFGSWDWIYNSSHSGSGCRIVVGWKNSRVNVIPIITSRQCLFCAIENLNNGKKLFYSFVYAANSGIERRALWKELHVSKGIAVNHPWMLLGYFNVTLKVEEHSAGGSFMSQDMNEFRECVNEIEVEDVCCSGLFFTWIKSPSKPSTSILKKLDRVLANEEFISSFSQARAKFLPYLVCDHSLVVCCIPNDLIKKVAKKLKLLKPYMNKINWKNRNLFDNVLKFREKLKELQTLVDSDPHNVDLKKAEAVCYDEYQTAIQDECKLLHQQAKVEWLSEGDKNSAYFHKIVKSRKHSSKIMAVYDDAVDQLEDMSSLFTNTLTSEDTDGVIMLVTDKEIQEAIFDIGDNKAPGPDGYTAKFFKKAWKIIGEDVRLAVREFFQTGKLIGQINATLISLVPKIKQPRKVTDYRPIACCNVLYKCISKILTNRIKGSLNKLVIINQSAFIPGKSIQDNIFITQELLKGYNRKGGPKICSLKIDIAKAYDTVDWGFLESILYNFSFPVKMIQWIMTCVSSAAFTISVNGERFGYFKGGRGLRQGDPISPYLFTLVMEVFSLIMSRNVQNNPDFKYHVGCKELKLTHFSFADDMLVLCHGDLKSVSVLKRALNEFSKVSGLLPNISKRVPLITKKIVVAECKIFMDKVKNVVLDWKNKSLSYAGRLQLISSVLASMQVYWASVFLIPKTTVRDIEKVLKGFLWCSGDLQKGKAKVSWKIICTPKDQGGLGLKKLDEWNETLLSKQIWKIATKKESLWVKWVNLVKLKGRNFWDVQSDVNDSWMWKVILDLRRKYRPFIMHQIGNGKNVSVWYDKWDVEGPLCSMINKRAIYNARLSDNNTVADMIRDGVWQWPQEWISLFPRLCSIQCHVLQNDKCDKGVWKTLNGLSKDFSVQQVWKDTRAVNNPTVNWSKKGLKGKIYADKLSDDWKGVINDLVQMNNNNVIRSIMRRIVAAAAVYYVWQERNKRIMANEFRSVDVLFEIILEYVKLKS
ncbi:RNA-directed DNA polymerase, eukaryota, reverse transcriptase zinc-binding domain protein [Tanacetum coccineum]